MLLVFKSKIDKYASRPIVVRLFSAGRASIINDEKGEFSRLLTVYLI